ncbi:helix-turn-helix transcriptional regulator [Brevundimonas sp.]|uniref:S24 family peptidase n=1 Tax=Brevundimonas sp. TaxID=1871086 RepID=UPI0025DEA08F|nr:helix-turn-helix transcriptional regulator [Brevundimonas sp.]
MPLSHSQIWSALDRLAAREGLTPSALARRADLDPTSFNPSKRVKDGRARWPSTESLTKVLAVLGVSLGEFAALAEDGARGDGAVPLLGFAQAGDDGFFDDGGFPAGEGWDRMAFPGAAREGLFALRVQGDSMLPAYRAGDRLVVDRTASDFRVGDRVVVRTTAGEVMAKELRRQTADRIELKSLNPNYPDRTLKRRDLSWMGRILWASQ